MLAIYMFLAFARGFARVSESINVKNIKFVNVFVYTEKIKLKIKPFKSFVFYLL